MPGFVVGLTFISIEEVEVLLELKIELDLLGVKEVGVLEEEEEEDDPPDNKPSSIGLVEDENENEC